MAKIQKHWQSQMLGACGAMGACSFPVGMQTEQPILENSLALFTKLSLLLAYDQQWYPLVFT